MNVGTILKAKGDAVVTVPSDAKLGDVVALLSEKRIGVVVVSDDGRTIDGILSERDIVHGLGREGATMLERTAAQVMTRDVVTCTEETPLIELLARMTRGRFRHVPVLAEGRLAGIVSIGDAVKHRLDQLEHEATQMREYIAGGI